MKSIILLFILIGTCLAQVPDAKEFEATRRPDNPTQARNILGYDSFQRTAKNNDNVQYGNNWEQYDTPKVQYNPEFTSFNRERSYDRYDDDRGRSYDRYNNGRYRDFRRY